MNASYIFFAIDLDVFAHTVWWTHMRFSRVRLKLMSSITPQPSRHNVILEMFPSGRASFIWYRMASFRDPAFTAISWISSSSQLRRIGWMTYLGMFSEHVSVPVTPHASILECRFDCYHIWRIADSSPSTPRLAATFLLSCRFQESYKLSS